MKKQSLVKGAFVLTLAAFITKVLVGYALDIPNIIRILVAGIAMGYIGRALFINLNNLTSQGGATLILLTGIVFSIIIYMLLLFF
ncbi:hypothetical protein [Desulfosporosinus sp.]|uniref:hypothetical protein n=1 Tax=Desulfosporosinus sp. TaxID=157907 RepID=UPI00231F800D|nr:hypothetical protein [Desulfosporosinus sp.]MCO5385076.1 hypothetical protein [Desulfosporosinus sp.]MDA8220598.1 hypothetical protein [Desulfitobacterium hafniense]